MVYNWDRDQIEMSVTELCTMALSSGSIDTSRPSVSLKERASVGRRVHTKLQTSFGALYHSEVELHNTSMLDGVCFYIKGRADGIICHNGNYTVDEIKTVSGNSFSSHEVDRLHTARLYCYAYFLCRMKELEGVNTRIIYYNVDDGDIEYNEKYTSLDELRDLYMKLLSNLLWRAEFMRRRVKDRLPKMASAVFPYTSLRDSQAEMIKECYRDIKNGNRLFCQAPTGIGKTISTLYPAAKCLGEDVADKIFYLTSKASIKREAYSAIEKMNKAGSAVQGIVLSSREQMCACDGAKLRGGRLSSNCTPELCSYARSYYERAPVAISEIMSRSDNFGSQYIKSFAKDKQLCPYEFQLDLSELCDVVICDYNYVFSPTARLKRYFDENEGSNERYIFLVDEAHNLPDRARDMFSCRITSKEIEELIRLAGETSAVTRAAISFVSAFQKLGMLCRDNMKYDADGVGAGYYVSRELPAGFLQELEDFSDRIDGKIKYELDNGAYFYLEELGYKLYEFKKICLQFDKHYLTFVNKNGEDVSLLLYCLDPSMALSSSLDRARASVMFSATLTPTEYFADILGGGGKSVSVAFDSPFPKENLSVAVMDKISTKYEDRKASYKKISSAIAATVSARVGNYMVFFPSYSYMEEVYKIFHAKYPKVCSPIQRRNMSYSERERFIGEFKDDGKTRVGFCVLGGSFSEGIDLPGKRLIGVVVVGVGLPGISDENNIICDYYEEKCGMGYDYAYTYPGMNSVLQAVGRVIRTETDKGIAVLIDERFSEPRYRRLFPKDWQGAVLVGDAVSLAENARRFWKNRE